MEKIQRPAKEKEIQVVVDEPSTSLVVRSVEKIQCPGIEKVIIPHESTTAINAIKSLQLALDTASKNLNVWTYS